MRTFRCPSCDKVIDTSMTACRHCSAPIDRNAAEAAADLHEKVNQAGFDASIVKQLGVWMPVALLVAFLPIIGIVGVLGEIVLFFAVPIFFIRWWIKYSGLQTRDPDFKSAKRATMIALLIWLPFGGFSFLSWVARFMAGR